MACNLLPDTRLAFFFIQRIEKNTNLIHAWNASCAIATENDVKIVLVYDFDMKTCLWDVVNRLEYAKPFESMRINNFAMINMFNWIF